MSPKPEEVEAYIALGSNLGDRAAHLAYAVEALEATEGIAQLVCSSVFETDPVGGPPQGAYLNAVVALRTDLEAPELLARMLSIEQARHRKRSGVPNEARSLDLDLLLYGQACINLPGLRVPHPRMQDRAFVLLPLCEVASGFVHPVLNRSIEELTETVMKSVQGCDAVRKLGAVGAYS